ncbi:MAG: hypothetical protein OEY05_06225 [Paracoccaceae bacterium]|nr:hypothetical protein [Paracoccaceae bacterium]MDH5529618.1 hypothetical protein [Paracoccaceae bacterium]
MKTAFLIAFSLFANQASAEAPVVVAASAKHHSSGWMIDVTITHPDTGWDHFASGWEVIAPDGSVLGYRELAHPHVDEQPFTRSLPGVTFPMDIDHVFIRPRCTLDGWVPAPTRLNIEGY